MELGSLQSIRNFSIIAHIDHGKSTLADRFIQLCGGLGQQKMAEQVLDTLDIERERGITIKSQSAALDYRALNGQEYRLNLIDTPGHVDFSYEVSRSLAACEGALLVVDATQGVEAQSIANCYTAVEQGLEVLPVLNKMDLGSAEPERVCKEIEEIIGLDASSACRVSARTGAGVRDVLEQVVARVPPPSGDAAMPLQALVLDSWFDRYLGVVSLVRIVHGRLHKGERIAMHSTGRTWTVDDLGIFTPQRHSTGSLGPGEVGFVAANIKDVHGAPVGDTLIGAAAPQTTALPGFQRIHPKVYAGLYPLEADAFTDCRAALERLALNDAALRFVPEQSGALGSGFRCGFLGLLHMEIVQERLEREYNLDLIATAPTVVYEVLTTRGTTLQVENPADLPPPAEIEEMREPLVQASILTPKEYLGAVLELCMQRRGVQRDMRFAGGQVALEFELPMSEVVADLFDRLKSVSRGFASLDYAFVRFQPAPLVRLEVLLNGEPVDALAAIVHRERVRERGRQWVDKMKEMIPRQMFDVAIQAAIGGRIVARQTVKALRKNVTAKCYGGDVTRKRKLLEKQRAGKKRMKRLGRVDVPQEAFLAMMRIDN